MEAIILAGGMGTRLKGLNLAVPKPMIQIVEKPFLEYILLYLRNFGIEDVIMSVGYRWKTVFDYFGTGYKDMSLRYSYEDIPLGTGGAIKKAMKLCEKDIVWVLNGDTFFDVDMTDMLRFHRSHGKDFTIAGKYMKNTLRYGSIRYDEQYRILAFEEKNNTMTEGMINGGIYLVGKNKFLSRSLPEIFSLEHDFLETYVEEENFMVYPSDGYFIDIGIPEDLKKVQNEYSHIRKYE